METKDPFKSFEPINRGSLPGKFSHAWVEESLIGTELTNNPFSAPRTKKYLGLSLSPLHFAILTAALILGLSIVVFRVGFLQLWQGNYYRTLAEENRLRLKPIAAERGVMYDRNHKQLIQNIPSFSLSITPHDIPRDQPTHDKVINYVAQLANTTPQSIDDLLIKYKSYSFASLIVKENLDYQSAINAYIESGDYPGVSIESGTKRLYTYSSSTLSFSHLFGYLSKLTPAELNALSSRGYLPSDSIGKSGLEKTYEDVLRGKFGGEKVEVNASGRELSVLSMEPPVPGKNLILSIDLEAQTQLEQLVKTAATKLKKQRVSAIAMDPRDGQILAMVSWPAYDANDFSGGVSSTVYNNYLKNPDRPLFNRSVSGAYPSGSTIKLIVAAAALNEHVVTPVTTIMSVGGIEVGPWYFKDWKAGGHGATNVFKALAWSVNTFFYYVGGGYKDFTGLGLDRLLEYYRKFHLAQKTGIDLPSENAGFLPSREWKLRTKNEAWYIGDTYNISIGQGDVLVTPLQDAVWTAAIANGGTLVTPHLVESIEDPTTKKETKISPKPQATEVVPASVAALVRQGARDCVAYGSCQLLKTLPFSSGAKTGTAQWSSTLPTHAWFTSFAPYDKPKIVVTVLVEEGGEGSAAAMPIARDFLSWWGKKYLTQ